MSKKETIFLWTLSLSLLLLAWPPAPFPYLILISYAPLLVYSAKTKSLKKLFFFLFSYYFSFVLVKFIGLLAEGDFTYGPIIALIELPLIWMLPFIGFHLLNRKVSLPIALLLFPFIYVLHEYWQYFWDLTFVIYHLPLALGNADLFNSIYPIIGMFGMSLLIISINTGLAYLPLKIKDRKTLSILLGSIVFILIAISFLHYSLNTTNTKLQNFTIKAFSPSSEKMLEVKDDFGNQISFLEKRLLEADLEGVNLIVGPESYLNDLSNNPLFTNNIDRNTYIIRLKEISEKKNVSILVGAVLVELFKRSEFPTTSAKKKEDGLYYEIYNGSILIDGNKAVQWRSKQVLLPILENIPFHNIINTLASSNSIIPRLDNTYGVKKNKKPYIVDDIKIITSICYEGLYPYQLTDHIQKQGADLQIIITNDWTNEKITVDQFNTSCKAVSKAVDKPTVIVGMNGNISSFLSKLNLSQL